MRCTKCDAGAQDTAIAAFLKQKRVFVFLGAPGSGKTENALNFAERCVKLTSKPVHLFDLNQTKQTFRARERFYAKFAAQIHVPDMYGESLLVPHGLSGYLAGEDICVLDVGGGEAGAVIIGQFCAALGTGAVQVFYVLNPYRAFSDSENQVVTQLKNTMAVAGLADYRVINNPNLGRETTPQVIVQGCTRLDHILSFPRPYLLSVEERYWDVPIFPDVEKLPLQLYLSMPMSEG